MSYIMNCTDKCGAKCHIVGEIRIKEKEVMKMLMGTYSHSLDAKGRLIIPAKLREELGETFIITKNLDNCLALYPNDEWERFIQKMDQLPKISSEPARRLRRFYFGNSLQTETDKQGRILIPGPLRTFANLTKDVVLVGVDDHLEVWDQETWNNYNDGMDLSDIAYDLDGIDL